MAPRSYKSLRHEHNLDLHKKLEAYTCAGCKENGAKNGYKCLSCKDFTLHEPCAVLGDEEAHPFDKQVKLRFRDKTNLQHRCDVCDGVIRGFVFESAEELFKSFRAHPLCIRLPHSRRFSGHTEHKIKLQAQKDKFQCSNCKKDTHGWRYRCKNTTCPLEVGVRCVMKEIYGPLTPCSKRTRDMLSSPGNYVVRLAGAVAAGAISGAISGEINNEHN